MPGDNKVSTHSSRIKQVAKKQWHQPYIIHNTDRNDINNYGE